MAFSQDELDRLIDIIEEKLTLEDVKVVITSLLDDAFAGDVEEAASYLGDYISLAGEAKNSIDVKGPARANEAKKSNGKKNDDDLFDATK
jgi:hypothetical protein